MTINEGHQQWMDRLREQPSGSEWSSGYSKWVRSQVSMVMDDVAQPGDQVRFVLVTTGSCARGEMSPQSDLDLAIIPDSEDIEAIRETVRKFNRRLNEIFLDGLKIKVDFAIRQVEEIPALDHVSLAGMMDAVSLWGSGGTFAAYRNALKADFPTGDFLLAKIEERRKDVSKTTESPLCVQPHLKLGAGGLRCAQTTDWIRRASGLPHVKLSESINELLFARNVSYGPGRAADSILSPRVARLCAEACEMELSDYMNLLLGHMVRIENAFQQTLIRIRHGSYQLRSGVTSDDGWMVVRQGTSVSHAALSVGLGVRLGLAGPLHAHASAQDIDGDRALRALAMGESVIRRLASSGLLGTLLPELQNCQTLLSDDLAHRYTVMEHSIIVARHIEEASSDSGFIGAALRQVEHRDVLILAALLHDVGKVDSSRPHEFVGAEMAAEICTRWRLEGYVKDRLCWLIEHHLLLAQAIQTRDVLHPDTARDLLHLIPDEDHLAMLTVFTWADTRAVGPAIWTPMQESLLETLYNQLHHQIVLQAPPSVSQHRHAAAARMAQAAIPEADVEDFLARLPGSYVLATPPDQVHRHYLMVQRAKSGDPEIDIRAVREHSSSEISIVCRDAPGLLSRALGIIYALNMSISGVRASTLEGDPAVAVDTITAAFREEPIPRATADRLLDALAECLQDGGAVDTLLIACGKDPSRVEEATSIKFHPGNPAIIEFHAKRGRGMAYRLSRQLANIGWNIVSARLGQWGGQGVATFYVQSSEGRGLTQIELEAPFRT